MKDLLENCLGIVNRTADAVLLNNNANKASERIPVMRDMVAGEMSKAFALEHILPKDVAKAHINGDIHYHDLDYSPFFPMINCFSEDTSFITTEGNKTFKDFKNGDVVFVPSHTGKIRKAVVRSYGKQKLNEVTFKRGKGFKTVKVTGSHRWILKDGTQTTNLAIGDKLLSAPELKGGEFDKLSWCLGFGYGDGSMADGYFRIRICGNKVKYANIFEDAGFNVTYPECYNGDGAVILHGYTKSLPTEGIDTRSFSLGYAAADASTRNIQATGETACKYIEECFDCAGLYIGGNQDFTDKDSNYGKRSGVTKMYNITTPNHYYWTVKSITPIHSEEVWCLEVEEDHSFLLSGGMVTGNCMLIDIKGMFKNGFKMGNADIEEPKSISTATAVCSQVIAQVASHIYGGTTINRIDEVLEPYVKASYNKHLADGKLWCKDEATAVAYASEMTAKETYSAFQGLEYEINTLHTSNGQTPFTTLGFGLGTTWEARLIQKAILKVRTEGLGKYKRTAVFPKLVFTIKDGVNHKKGDVNYDIKQLAMTCSAARMYPDILNYERVVEATGGFKAPMGCRSFLHEHPDGPDGRNNLGVVSINIPRIAYETDTEEEFFELLNERMLIAKKALMTRIDSLRGVKADSAPILYMEGACGKRLKADDEIMQLFDNGRASISLGYIGLHEAAMSMFNDGAHTFDSYEKQKFCVKVVQALHDACEEWKEETGFAFSVYSTPSESLCDRFCRLDAEKFGEQEGITDKGYYTNSFHLDVFKKVAPHQKIDFEAPFPYLATGGHISFCELPDVKRFIPVVELVWDHSFERIPYMGINTPTDFCEKCSFAGETVATEDGFTCPVCGNHDNDSLQVVRRVCGYLGAPNARPFIEGKQKEVIGRVKHMGD